MDVKKTITVDQSLEKVWQIMATDYTKIGEWTSAVDYSKPNGAIKTTLEDAPAGGRVCTAPDFGDIKETITQFNEDKKKFSYKADASAMPGFVKGISNDWSFRSLGPKKTEVNMHIHVDLNAFPGALMSPLMRIQMTKAGNTVLELKYYAETGNIHPRKVKALKKAGRTPATA